MANIVITGANRGIGLELARLYSARGESVAGICRTSSEELDAVADHVISGIDMSDEASLVGLQTVLAELVGSVDVLINNAGIFKNETLNEMSVASVREQLEINSIAPLVLTHALLPLMNNGAKIGNITSRMGSMADNTSGAYYGYRASKAALNAIGKSLAMDLKPKGIAVAQLHPGFVQTRMVGFSGDISPEDAARGLAHRMDELTLENSGGFWHSNGEVLPW